jgi:Protein of unknown function (DUF559)
MTPQEVKLWVQLKYLNRTGRDFRRQVSIDGYIVDFAEFSQRLIIEMMGRSTVLRRVKRPIVFGTSTLPRPNFRFCAFGTMRSIETWTA